MPDHHPVSRSNSNSRVLTIDIGGSRVKALASGHRKPVKADTGTEFNPSHLVQFVEHLPEDWEYERISIGFPGRVSQTNRIRVEPLNLGKGWVNFDFERAFGKPTIVVNDAVLQAIGSYEGGRMIYLGLGTGVGSAFIADHHVFDFELGALLYHGEFLVGDVLTKKVLRSLGKRKWSQRIRKLSRAVRDAFLVDYVVLGGGNAEHLTNLPKRVRQGDNKLAFKGGERLWTTSRDGEHFILHTSKAIPLS